MHVYYGLNCAPNIWIALTITTSPYVGGSDHKPRDIRTLRRWRASRRGPAFRKIGGRIYYTVEALREFYQRSVVKRTSAAS